MANIGMKLFTALFGKLVGEDQYGNKYYRSKKKEYGKGIGRPNTERRWVLYAGSINEPSKVPPLWHAWLHQLSNEIPTSEKIKDKYKWQKEHVPNLTGTQHAYYPPGHILSRGQRDAATGDYVAWNPEEPKDQ